MGILFYFGGNIIDEYVINIFKIEILYCLSF